MTGRARTIALALTAVAALGAASGCGAGSPDQGGERAASVTAARSGFAGTVLDPPIQRPRLVLPDTRGKRFDLPRRPPGEVTVLFFGYTNCDDVCPTTMADLAAARRAVPAALRDRVTVVFVTEDPARDTPAVLRRWLDRFDPAIVGLIGGGDSTRTVLEQLHLPGSIAYAAEPEHAHGEDSGDGHDPHPSRVPGATARPTGNYEVEHAGVVYVFGPRRRTLIYTGGTSVARYATDFARLARPGP